MIRKTLTAALILLSCTMYSQRDIVRQKYPDGQLRAGFVFTDLISNRFRLDVDYRFSGPQVVGIGAGLLYGTEDMDNRIFNSERQPLNGFYTNASYKYYYAANRSGKVFHFIRLTGFYQNANVTYYGYDFVPFEEDGVNYYNYDEVDLTYNAQTLGGQMEIGFEFYFDPFFMEIAFGMQYRQKVKGDELPSQFRSGDLPFDIDYTGPSPMIAYKLGVYLD